MRVDDAVYCDSLADEASRATSHSCQENHATCRQLPPMAPPRRELPLALLTLVQGLGSNSVKALRRMLGTDSGHVAL
eukprot:5216899-Pyramimonas_sp.AAC.1